MSNIESPAVLEAAQVAEKYERLDNNAQARISALLAPDEAPALMTAEEISAVYEAASDYGKARLSDAARQVKRRSAREAEQERRMAEREQQRQAEQGE